MFSQNFIVQQILINSLISSVVAPMEQFEYEDIIEVKSKLELILATLEQENQDTKKFYLRKIAELYDQIVEKDSIIQQLQRQAEQLQKKSFDLEWKIIDKDQLIDHLSSKLKAIEKTIKQNITPDFKDTPSSLKHTSLNQVIICSGSPKQKRINISQYFIKLSDHSKEQKKNEKQISCNSSTFSTLIYDKSGQNTSPVPTCSTISKKSAFKKQFSWMKGKSSSSQHQHFIDQFSLNRNHI